MVTTLVARMAQSHQTTLVADLTPYDPAYQSSLQSMTTALAARGDALVTAHQQAVGSMYHTLLTQANLLAYLDNFRWFTLLCFACLVGALLLKNVKVPGPMAAH
jgi:DHA2 family multidrug resistance protein